MTRQKFLERCPVPEWPLDSNTRASRAKDLTLHRNQARFTETPSQPLPKPTAKEGADSVAPGGGEPLLSLLCDCGRGMLMLTAGPPVLPAFSGGATCPKIEHRTA